MSEPKWTPGPWRWWTSNSWRRLSSDHRNHPQDGGVLCPTVSRSDGHPDLIVSDADMALIAAAPDLYEACHLLLTSRSHHPDPEVVECRVIEGIQKGLDAMRKARGE